MKLPAIQFYPADWRKDPGVQSLDYFDRGVWFEILCLMHESPERGKLILNGAPMPDEALARILGLDNQTLVRTLTTLLKYGVATRDESGVLINRRMVKDERLRQVRTESGRKGGNPVLLNQNPTKGQPTSGNGANQNPTPSSSSSVSSSTSEEKNSLVAQARLVFEFWQEHMKHPRANMDDKRGKAIKQRLKDGYTVADLQAAIRGCKLTPFNMGQNERQEVYDGIDLICRDADHVDRFMRRAGVSVPTAEDRQAREARMSREKGWDKLEQRAS